MTHNKFFIPIVAFGLLAGLNSCRKDAMGILNTGNFSDTAGTLKSVAVFPVGFAAYQGDAGFAQYFPIIVKEGTNITPGNEMKHGSIVQSSGALGFTNADALVNQATTAGLGVFGHTLYWHSQQNAGYLNSIAGEGTALPTSLMTNGGFESGLTGWAAYNTNGATFSQGSASESFEGTSSLKVVNPTAWGAGNGWRVQYASPSVNVTANTDYIILVSAKAASAGGKIQIEGRSGSDTKYSGDLDVGTGWTTLTMAYTATTNSASVVLDLGAAANTYTVDNVKVYVKSEYDKAVAASTGPAIIARLDSVMQLWIVGTPDAPGIVAHYKGKVKAWDVANEVLADNGSLRVAANTDNTTKTAPGYFSWNDKLGKDGPLTAFKYAVQADPDALLFINDYNLEFSRAKTDSIVSYVNYLKSKGAKVDGIGTQMHVDINTNRANIDYMFTKLAATGLLVRVSELDVKMNPSGKVEFSPEPVNLTYQAEMYKYIVESYINNVPAAQRYGITIWGVDDKDSWLYKNGQDLPLLFDKNYAKKPAYSAVLQALKGTK